MAREREIDWAAVRAAYEGGRESVRAIRARFGITDWAMRSRRTAEGWGMRPRVVEPGDPQASARTLARRLSRLIAAGAERLEARIAAEGLNEGTARMIVELSRAQEAVMRATRTPKPTKTTKTGGEAREAKHHDGPDGRGADDAAARAADLARKRADLKKRVSRIRRELGLG